MAEAPVCGYQAFASVAQRPFCFLQPGLTHNLPTAGVVSVQFDQEDWDLYEQPKTELLVHDWPKK